MKYRELITYLETLTVTQALWWFIENCEQDDPNRSDLFFYLRARYREEGQCPNSDKPTDSPATPSPAATSSGQS